MKFILICAIGRTASTTLQRIINTIPDSNITGEKFGAIENLLECYKNIKNTVNNTKKHNNEFLTFDELKQKNIKPSWYNSFDFEEVINNIKNTIISILNKNDSIHNVRILGYKEIRWINYLYLLDEFLELFPDTKIIYNIDDDVERQSQSGWFKEHSNSKELILEYNKQMINHASKNKKGYLSFKKNLFKLDEVKKMFLFLDETLNEEEYKFIINNNLG
jgi:hypothetical protein